MIGSTDARGVIVLLNFLVSVWEARLLRLELGKGLSRRVLSGCNRATFARRCWLQIVDGVRDAIERAMVGLRANPRVSLAAPRLGRLLGLLLEHDVGHLLVE